MEGNVSKHLTLDVVVPSDREVNIASRFENINNDSIRSGKLEDIIPQRRFVFLDESLTVYVVLKSLVSVESVVCSLLPRLRLQVEVGATGIPQGPPPKIAHPKNARLNTTSSEVLKTISPDENSAPIRVELSGSDSDTDGFVYRFWPLQVHLNRPRSRLQRISIYFHSSGIIAPSTPKNVPGSDYLPSGIAAASNLLDALANEPEFADCQPRLSALRMSKVVPAARSEQDSVCTIRASHQRSFRAAPLLLWRIRYIKPQEPPKTNSLIASLDFEITHFAPCKVNIKDITLRLSSGSVEPLTSDSLQLEWNNGDQAGYTYRLLPSPDLTEMMGNENREHELSLRLIAEALHPDGHRSDLEIDWTMDIDFSTHTKFGHKRARSALLNQNTSIEIPKAQLPPPMSAGPAKGNSYLMDPAGRSYPTQHTLNSGVVLGLRSPSRVNVGHVFSWKVLVINRSPAVVRLGLYVVLSRSTPGMQRVEGGNYNEGGGVGGAPRPPSGQAGFRGLDAQEEWIPDAVVADNPLLFHQHEAELEQPSVLCLSPESRVGPLGPTSCFSVELKFLPTGPGILQVDAIRVVDFATQQVVDVRDLPDVVCVA